MSKSRLVVKNTAFLAFGELLSRLLSLLLIVFIAKYLGDIGLGKYSFIFAFVGIFSIFSDFGANVYMTHKISQDQNLVKEYLGKIFVFKLILGAIASLIPVIAIILTKQSLEIKIGILLAGFNMFIYYIAFPFRSVVNAFEMQKYHSLYLITERFIAISLGIFVLYKGYGLLALISVLIISNISSFLILYKLVSKNIIRLYPRLDLDFIKSFLKKSYPFWLTSVFMTVYFKIDTIMLSFLKDYSATGLYNASYRIIEALLFIPSVFISVLFPLMSRFYKNDKNLLNILYEKAFYYLILLALPLGMGTMILADRIILFIYKQTFINSVFALKILIWALVLMFVNYLMGYLLNSIEKQMLFTYTAGIGVILNITLNLILIPLYSFTGAAIATVVTELSNFILLYYFTLKNGFSINIFKSIFKPLIATLFMGVLIVFYIKNFHLLFAIPLSMLFYFLALFLIGGIKKDEKNILISYLKR